MAKKKTIDLRSVDPTPVPAGDVNIIYNGVRIGGFSEDTEAVLKTAGCRVEQDINVNYTKPSGDIQLIPAQITFETERPAGELIDSASGSYLKEDNNGNLISVEPEDAAFVVPTTTLSGNYIIGIYIFYDSDMYNVTLNGTPVPYNSETYMYNAEIESATYPESFYLTVTEKQV